MKPFEKVTYFEEKVAEFYSAPYAVAVDCCTHGLELALRHTQATEIFVPKHTYLSIPMLADKLNIKRNFIDSELYYNFSTSEKHQMCNQYASINYDYTQPFVLQEPNQTGNHVNINSNGFRGSEIDFNNDNYQIFF